MLADALPFFGREAACFGQHGVGDADLAYIMQQGPHTDPSYLSGGRPRRRATAAANSDTSVEWVWV